MAENKKGFILYADQIDLFKQLPNDKAGELIKHIFSYVNDEEPDTDDLIINLAFTPIKKQFKRDLEKWEKTRKVRSDAGKKSAESRRNKKEQTLTNSTNVKSVEQNSTNPTVSVNDNVNVNVNDNVIKKKKDVFSFRKALIELGAKENLATEWIKVRKNKKSTNSEIALNSFKKQLALSNLDINKALEECIIHSWSGFKAEWIKGSKQNNKPRKISF